MLVKRTAWEGLPANYRPQEFHGHSRLRADVLLKEYNGLEGCYDPSNSLTILAAHVGRRGRQGLAGRRISFVSLSAGWGVSGATPCAGGSDHMDTFTSNDLRMLAEAQGEHCVSIFMPTHRGGQESQQDRIRLKNLLKDAEERLLARGMRRTEAEAMLEPAERLLPEGLFWTYKSDGLALFFSPAFFRYYRLPTSFEEALILNNRFHIKPLLPQLSGDGRFYLLAFGQRQVRFFEGSRHQITELDVKTMPRSLADALKYTDSEKQLQFHTGTAQTMGGGKRSAMYHGHGVGGEVEKDHLRDYFEQIDAGLHEVLRDKRDPLVLAGVEYLLPIYKEANTYQNVMEAGVLGNPEEQNPQDLHKQAWPIAERYFLKEQEERLAQYEELVGAGKTSNDLKEILPASYAGRVDCLFVAVNGNVCGTFDPANGQVNMQLTSEPGPCDEDLVDLAAVQTIMHAGTVYPIDPARIPGGAPAAATFRY